MSKVKIERHPADGKYLSLLDLSSFLVHVSTVADELPDHGVVPVAVTSIGGKIKSISVEVDV